jgi:gamma-glutamylcyclotransferase (GGCT)/AIG2-like uncharacterized protein YtfP
VAGATRERIFLYGTLRRGGMRDVLEFYDGVEFVAPAEVRGFLYDLGDYPGLRLSESGGWVKGELFDATPEALRQLDEWEGIDSERTEPAEYRRVRTIVRREGGASETVWIYEIDALRCEGRAVMASGDWLTR